MTTTITPYEEFKSGDLIEAERMNGMQVKIKQDIAGQVGQVSSALQEHIQAPVDAAKFGGKTPQEWKGELDERYVMRAEIGTGWGEYRRYFKQIDRQWDKNEEVFQYGPAIIEHKLQRYPLITLFELVAFTGVETSESTDNNDVKFLVYYAGHRDSNVENLQTQGLDVTHWGDPLSTILDQFGLQVTPDQLFDDVLNDLWDHMFDPGLEQDHFERKKYDHSDYVQSQIVEKGRTVGELQKNGVWEDLRMAIRPRMISTAVRLFDPTKKDGDAETNKRVELYHLSQNALEIRSTESIDLMVLLRT